MDNLMLEPLKFYNQKAKNAHAEAVTAHFDDMVARSGVNVDANRETVKKYHATLDCVNKLNKKIAGLTAAFVLLIVLGIAGVIALIVGITGAEYDTATTVGLIVGGALVAVISAIAAFAYIRPMIKAQKKIRNEQNDKANSLLSEAQSQMAPLNAMFNSRDTIALIEKVIPELDFYPTYTCEHNELLINEYDYIDLTDDQTSVIDALSGKFRGNPFLYERYVEHSTGTQTYTGTLVISWTTVERDSSGKSRTVHHSQTLRASVTKPKPYYNISTHLGYGSQAAPDLSFSRTESDTDELSDRALERRIKKGERKLKKMAEKSITDGGNFHEMANSEFDVLYGAHNRNHEVQFRLLFTPLAQTNTVDLLRSKDGYGDDFNFIKQGKFNIVKSLHAKNWPMTVDPSVFRSYDIDAAKKSFESFNIEYFKSVFFDFAPIMAIPAYMEEPIESEKTVNKYQCNYSQYEHEALVNAIGYRAFVHPNSATEAILKTTLIDKKGDVDRIRVTAYSYQCIDRIDYVTMMGGDGRLHAVPVPWVEYIPVSAGRDVLLKASDKNVSQRDVAASMHGIVAVALDPSDGYERIDKVINGN